MWHVFNCKFFTFHFSSQGLNPLPTLAPLQGFISCFALASAFAFFTHHASTTLSTSLFTHHASTTLSTSLFMLSLRLSLRLFYFSLFTLHFSLYYSFRNSVFPEIVTLPALVFKTFTNPSVGPYSVQSVK